MINKPPAFTGLSGWQGGLQRAMVGSPSEGWLGGGEWAKVYVSSTIADLKRERRAVLDWLRLARHQAVDSYLPDSESVRDSCLSDVGTCDLYVLILGHRYGFQPAEDNPEGLSITHLEFRRAGECGIPAGGAAPHEHSRCARVGSGGSGAGAAGARVPG